jgi:hypothetical protein
MRNELTSCLVYSGQRWQVNDSCKARKKRIIQDSCGTVRWMQVGRMDGRIRRTQAKPRPLKAQEGANYVIVPSEAQYDFEDRWHFQISAP